jgi:hypothetical protein
VVVGRLCLLMVRLLSVYGRAALGSGVTRQTGIVCAKSFRRAYLLGIINARAAWMFHGRAYAGGRFACLYRIAYMGTP